MCNDQYICNFGFNGKGDLYFIVMDGDNLLSLDQLTQEVTRLLQEYGLDVQHDHRVSPVPDLRTIRYYTSLGLVDRPVADPPRQAKYKMRHVWQLLAIKALQGAQLSLSDVQSKLYGLSESELKVVVESFQQSLSRMRPEQDELRALVWREFQIAPGVKVMVADGWNFDSESEKVIIQDKLRAVLEATARAASGKRTNGGSNE